MSLIVTDRDVRKKLASLEGQDIKELGPWAMRERVLRRHKDGRVLNGATLPWSKTHDKVRLRPGEVSVWAGYNGSCKSTILTQVALWASLDIKVGILSFEMEVEDLAVMMAQMAGGTAEPSTSWVNDFCTWADSRIAFYDRLDTVPPDQVISAVDFMADDLGCGLVVVDSLMMCGVADDLDLERRFLQTLTAQAKLYQTHIALVHHMRKPSQGDESRKPSKFDIRGSGGISDLAHTIFICWADKQKRNLALKVEEGIPLVGDEATRWAKAKDMPDQLLIVAKQRHAQFEGAISLWQHSSRQFTGDGRKEPMLIDIPRMEGPGNAL